MEKTNQSLENIPVRVRLQKEKDALKKNLYEVLETIFEDPTKEPDLQPLREILVALVEDGGLHCYHGKDKPVFGKHPCARITPKRKGCAQEVYC